jgi:glutamate-1-semialdehyde 2,1-aminomutase
LEAGLRRAALSAGARVSISRVGSLLTVFFRESVPTDASEALTSDREVYARFFGRMLERGVLLPPSPFEAWFLSLAHGDAEIDAIVDAAGEAFAA